MSEVTSPVVPDRPIADPAANPPQPFAASAMNMADAIEIAQTCTLAGRTDLIAGFLEAGAAPATVRSRLLAAQAEASPEITSRIAPDAHTAVAASHHASPDNPLIQAVKTRVAAHP